MSLSRVYKINTELQALVQAVELDQVSGLNGGRTIGAKGAADPEPFPSSAVEPVQPEDGKSAKADTTRELDLRIRGLEEAQTRFNEAAQALASALEETSRLRKSILAGSTDDMLRLVLAIGEQLVQNELRTDPEIIVRIISQALNSAIKSDSFHVKVSTEDFELVNERKPLFLASLSGLKNVSFEADPQIARGGCLVESDLGQVDATMEVRMAEIQQQLASSVSGGNATAG